MTKRLLILLLLLCSSVLGQVPYQKPMMGQQIDWNNPLSKGLVGYWLMNEGGGNIVQDLSGNGNDGVIGVGYQNESIWSTGKFGTCLGFPSARDRMDVGAIPLLLDDSGNKTVNLFVQIVTTTGTYNGCFDTGIVVAGEVPTYPGMGIYTNYQGLNVRFAVAKNDVDYVITPTHTLTLNTWHMLTGVFVKATGTAYLYVDGNLIGSNTNANVTSYAGDYFRVGQFSNYGLTGGSKADVLSFYNRALSAGEIADLYRNPFGIIQPTFSVWWYSGIGGEPPATFGQVIMISN